MSAPLLKKLGRIRYDATVATVGRYLALRSAQAMRRYDGVLERLPPVPNHAGATLEVHMVCGERDARMGMWASWSLLRFLPSSRLFIHSDGSLPESTCIRWRRLIADVVFVTAEQATARVDECLRPYPLIREWRSANRTGRKLADPHLFGDTARILVVDSDILCFQSPSAVVERAARPAATYAWNRDMAYAYVAPEPVLSDILPGPLPDRVNSGFILYPRSGGDVFAYVEGLLDRIRRDGRIAFDRMWFEQTLAAACIARFAPDSRPLPDAYAVSLGRTKGNQIVRHYVGSPLIRPRFYSEGVGRIVAGASLTS